MSDNAAPLISAALGSLALTGLVALLAWLGFGYAPGEALWLGVKIWLGLNAVLALVAVAAPAVGRFQKRSEEGSPS